MGRDAQHAVKISGGRQLLSHKVIRRAALVNRRLIVSGANYGLAIGLLVWVIGQNAGALGQAMAGSFQPAV